MKSDDVRLAQLNLPQFPKICPVHRSFDRLHSTGKRLHRIRLSRPLEDLRQKRRHSGDLVFHWQFLFRITPGMISSGLIPHVPRKNALIFRKGSYIPGLGTNQSLNNQRFNHSTVQQFRPKIQYSYYPGAPSAGLK